MKTVLLNKAGMWCGENPDYDIVEKIRVPVPLGLQFDQAEDPPRTRVEYRQYDYSHTVGKVRFYREVA